MHTASSAIRVGTKLQTFSNFYKAVGLLETFLVEQMLGTWVLMSQTRWQKAPSSEVALCQGLRDEMSAVQVSCTR